MMFSYYRRASWCIAYLEDVNFTSHIQPHFGPGLFASSRWFKRGRTLQELIAPDHITFTAHDWMELGSKHRFMSEIHAITSIDTRALQDPDWMRSESIGSRMSWTAGGDTTRDEDQAYCLTGIFDVNMPLLYGEGGVKAFIRLQEEILKTSSDHTLFSWTTPRDYCDHGGLLAHSPQEFSTCQSFEKRGYWFEENQYDMTNLGLRITLPTIHP